MKEALDSIIAFRPDDWEARRQRSLVAWETADWASLEADYNALAKHYPSDARIFERRGLLRWYMGKIDSACWDFRYVQIFTSGLHSHIPTYQIAMQLYIRNSRHNECFGGCSISGNKHSARTTSRLYSSC